MSEAIVNAAEWKSLVRLQKQQQTLFSKTAANIFACAGRLETAIDTAKLHDFVTQVEKTSKLALHLSRKARAARTDKARVALFRDKQFRQEVLDYSRMYTSPLHDGNKLVSTEEDGKFARLLQKTIRDAQQVVGKEKERLDIASWQIWVAQHQLEALVDQAEVLLAFNTALCMAASLQWIKHGRKLKITGEDAV